MPLPGAVSLACCRAITVSGTILDSATCSLFCQPVTTPLSPSIIALKPLSATSAGSSFLAWPSLVSIRSARSKNSVSVAPGIRQVTVTPQGCSSARSA